jgi:hypothetical protein
VFAKRCDACMVFEMHATALEFLPVGIPPALHVRLVLQPCDDDDNWDLLSADSRVKKVVVPNKSATGSRAAHTVYQKADAIRFRAHELIQQALQVFFRLGCWYRACSALVETRSIE